MDMRPLADALRYFCRRIGSFHVARVVRDIVESWGNYDWGPVPRLMLLAHMRVKDPQISAAIRGKHCNPYSGRFSDINPRGDFDRFVRDLHGELGLIRPE